MAGEHFVADAAVEAFARLAVLAAQLQQSLRRERVVTLHPMLHKQRHHRVILRSQCMKHLHRGIAHRCIARSRAVSVEKRYHRIDCQHIHRISPEGHRLRIFSVKQLVELLKAIAMMAVIGIVAYQTIKDKLPLILTFYNIPLYTAIAAVGNILVDMGIRVSAVFLIIGFADLIFQRHKFKTDNMMTKQEVKDEFKNSEGDPQVKGQVKRRMMEISRRRMMEALPEADVVITNPTHFAVALKYEPNSGKAPVVIAKGADYLAFQIKDKAKEYHIEIVENKPLARILYHNVDIGMEIPPELYQVVAEILARVLQPGKQKTMLL